MPVIAPILIELVKTGAQMIATWVMGNAEQRAEVEALAQKNVDESTAGLAALKAKWPVGDAETQAIIDAEKEKQQ